jgi:hypothetical protein
MISVLFIVQSAHAVILSCQKKQGEDQHEHYERV